MIFPRINVRVFAFFTAHKQLSKPELCVYVSNGPTCYTFFHSAMPTILKRRASKNTVA